MKKIIITLIFGMFLIGFITAGILNPLTIFDNFEDALDEINSEIDKKKLYINNLKLDYEYVSDKTCEYLYEYEEFLCKICYQINTPINESSCTYLPNDFTREQDDEIVLEHIKIILGEDYDYKNIQVSLRNEKGRVFK